jgi:Zn-dependent peptidase ImmA (M78 family)
MPDTPPQEAAIYARSMLGLPPDEPIRNVTIAVERSGAIVLKLTDLPEHVGGFSAWIQEPISRPLIVCRSEVSAFRLRFTISHELGHMLLDHQVFGRPTKDTEAEANTFAAHFLLPEEAMHDVFSAPLDLRELARIKGRWGVSMNAILLRAKGMGYVDEGRYRALYETMRKKGWLRQEPGDATTKPENPALLKELLERHQITDSFALAEKTTVGIRDARSLLPSGSDIDLSALIKS